MGTENLAIERVGTFIEQLDLILKGGFPAGSKVLITGAPGTMKTSLAYSVLYNNAFADRLYGGKAMGGLYISIEQDTLTILKHVHNMGLREFDDSRLRLACHPWSKGKSDKKTNVQLDALAREGWWKSLTSFIEEQMRSTGARLLVVDSLTAMMDRTDTLSRRESLSDFFDWLGKISPVEDPVTTLLIQEENSTSVNTDMAAYLADGTLYLFSEKEAQIQRLYLRCEKMRMTDHDRDPYLMDFHDGGFVLNPLVLRKRM